MTALTPTLVGRDADLRRLCGYLDVVRTGKTVLVSMRGASGVGKTTLTHAFLDWTMRFRDTVVLQGRCYERESVPFKALGSVVDDLVRFLIQLPDAEVEAVLPRDPQLASRLFPVLDLVPAIAHAPRRDPLDSDSIQRRRAGLAGLRELLGRIANHRTLVIHVDDGQWGDADSANALCEILRQPDAPLLMLVLSGRADQRNLFQDFFGNDNPSLTGVQMEQMLLSELTREAGINLAAQLLPAGESIGPDKIAAAAGGNPFLIGELAREAQFQGTNAPFSFEHLIPRRLTQLSAEARRVLEVSALAGQPLPVETARLAADVARLDAAVLYELERLHLARMTEFEGAPAIDCYHDRVRQVLVATVPPERARLNHRDLARALEATGGPEEALALHFHAAGDTERAIEHARKAAAAALQGLAFASAVRLYRLVLSLLPPEATPATKDVLIQLGDALVYAGASYEAAQVYLKADALCTGDEQLEVRRRALHQLLTTAHFDEATTLAENLLATFGLRIPISRIGTLVTFARYRLELRLRGFEPRHPRPTLSSAELVALDTAHSLALGLSVVDTLRGAVFQTQHTLMALRSGDPFRAARALASEAAYRSIRGRKTQVEVSRILDRARQLAVQSGQPYAHATCILAEGIAAAEWGHFRRALALCDDATRALRPSPGSDWERNTAHVFSLISLYNLGEWTENRSRAMRLVEEARQREDFYAETTVSLFAYARLLADDDPEKADVEQRALMSRWQNPTLDVQQFFLTYGWCEVDLYSGRASAARDRIERLWPALRRSLLFTVQAMDGFAHYLRARCAIAIAAQGDLDALKVAQSCARRLEQLDVAWNSAFADVIYAGIEGVAGKQKRVEARLESARVKLAVASMSPWLAAVSHWQSLLNQSSETDDTEWFDAQEVRNRERLSTLLVPGISSAIRRH